MLASCLVSTVQIYSLKLTIETKCTYRRKMNIQFLRGSFSTIVQQKDFRV